MTALTLVALLATASTPALASTTSDASVAIDVSEAVDMGAPDTRRWSFLKPKRVRLPQNPYGSTDFTSYTLEAGEVKLGLTNITVGLADRFQVGTSPALDAIGVYNAAAKLNLFRAGPVDLAVGGSHYRLPVGDFTGQQSNASAMVSVRVAKPWSLHVTGTYSSLSAAGVPDLSSLPPLLMTAAGDPDLTGAQQAVNTATADKPIDAHAQTASVRVATDVRLNRRDSLVLQGTAMVWGDVETGVNPSDLPPILGLDAALAATQVDGAMPLSETYVASVAWQLQWRSAELRVGAGVSSVPGAWLLQSTEFAWRFGGETKRGERHLRTAWRRNKRVARRTGGAPETIDRG
jgi:hypothetical protein